ncbi:MAG TPA: FAD:protein FMN transferase [Chthoniobacterales bacterium]|nr:FAD:protein FMN transferase [Chthoniobacterales bacterium]
MSRSVELRRARPLLGTFVEIAARAPNEHKCRRALTAGFAAIARVQRLMSRHDPASDLSRLNAGEAGAMHPWTHTVLRAARQFAEESKGVFDVAWGGPERRDLGGIAKGFAVDRAVDALRDAGATGGIVNAGGDLRAFGDEPQLIVIRHPVRPGEEAGRILLRDCALATSSCCFAPDLFDGRDGAPIARDVSVTVSAADCLTADALTKIALVLRERALPLLVQHGADAFLLERDLPPRWLREHDAPQLDHT